MVILFSQLSSSLTVSPGWASSSSSAVCPGEAAKVFLVFVFNICMFICGPLAIFFYSTKNSCCKNLIDRPNQLFFIWIFIC